MQQDQDLMHWWFFNITSGNDLVPSDNDALHEPVLTKLYDAIYDANKPQQVKFDRVKFWIVSQFSDNHSTLQYFVSQIHNPPRIYFSWMIFSYPKCKYHWISIWYKCWINDITKRLG